MGEPLPPDSGRWTSFGFWLDSAQYEGQHYQDRHDEGGDQPDLSEFGPQKGIGGKRPRLGQLSRSARGARAGYSCDRGSGRRLGPPGCPLADSARRVRLAGPGVELLEASLAAAPSAPQLCLSGGGPVAFVRHSCPPGESAFPYFEAPLAAGPHPAPRADGGPADALCRTPSVRGRWSGVCTPGSW